MAFASPPRVLGTAKGDFVVPDDFDDPLLEEVLAEFEQGRFYSIRPYFCGPLPMHLGCRRDKGRCLWMKRMSCT